MESYVLGFNNVTSFIVNGPVGASVGACAPGMTAPKGWVGLCDAVLDRHVVPIADGQPTEPTKTIAASISSRLRASVACRAAIDLDRLSAAWLRQPAERAIPR